MRRRGRRRPRTSSAARCRRVALVACVAALGGGGAGSAAPASAASFSIRPFSSVEVATSNGGEAAVVWRTTKGATLAAIGTPGTAFSAPVTVAAEQPITSDPEVAMDAAGNVAIVWESYGLGDCGKYDCERNSLGVFATLRPAGGSFGAPVRLARAQPRTIAGPRLAMNRAGDWVLAMRVGAATVVGAGRGATPPAEFTALPMPTLHAFALDEAGAATFAGVDSAQRPATVVRHPDGSFVSPQLLDGPSTAGLGVRLGVGPRGDALAVWPAGNEMHWASRPPGGSFGGTGSLAAGTPSPVAAVAVGVDGAGRTMTILPAARPGGGLPLVVLRGTTAAPFAEAATLTEPGHVPAASPTFALGADGTAAVAWPDSAGSAATPRLSVAFKGGPFSGALGFGGDASLPALAVDGGGRAVAAWLAIAGDAQRVLAARFSPAGPGESSILAEAPLTAMAPFPQPSVAFAPSPQRLRIRADRTVRPQLRCVAASTCRGTLRIDVRPAPGRDTIRLGTHRFVLPAGGPRRVTVRATRAARRAALRRSLRGTITVRTTMAIGPTLTRTTPLTIRRTTRR